MYPVDVKVLTTAPTPFRPTTSSTNVRSRLLQAVSMPLVRTYVRLYGEPAVAYTAMPLARATCANASPRPPEVAWIRIDRLRPLSWMLLLSSISTHLMQLRAVKKTVGSVAASSDEMTHVGLGASRSGLRQMRSLKTPFDCPKTASPTLYALSRIRPTPTMVPEKSLPVDPGSTAVGYRPMATRKSRKFRATDSTLTWTISEP
mmetsp:Transcript_10667/g.29551  ORF Transcript_10667/g.29551 Transcript_10667/m.29551 type:complete len:203 (-) Transcript_10667:5563-6171(-)